VGESTTRADALARGREAFERRAWGEAYARLSAAARDPSLAPADLELRAGSAYMLGRDDAYVSGLERAYRAYLAAGDAPRAVRCAFWIGHSFLFRGASARAAGWFARGQRALARDAPDSAARGYLLIPVWLEQMDRGEYAAGYATAVDAAAIGERFGDADLVWLARDEQACALLQQGRVREGLRLADEALVVATSGELSPIVTGIVYCNTIAFCRDAYELRHVREWTEALTRWCARQPEMVAHNGLCLVHRAEIMTLGGAWRDALEELRRLDERFTRGALNQRALGQAAYQQGEVRRLQGEFGAAEAAYREASRIGRDPQPGLALLRLAQGDGAAAAAAIRRALGELTERLERAALLPAYVEIVLAGADVAAARGAAHELQEVAHRQGSDALGAMAAYARGAVALAEGDARAALLALRRAWQAWQALEAPYEVARSRALVGLACRALGDEEAARLELEAARGHFARLGAGPDLGRVDALLRPAAAVAGHGLTRRELQVLRLVATGATNKAIAAELVLSERTVDRHVSNLLTKLGLASRAAATAYAYRHRLV
jgi:DNA-binding CsgD family transcriptional regulator